MTEEAKIPLGQRLRQLWKSASSAQFDQQQKIMAEAYRIEDIIFSRNLKGIEREKAGDVDKAKELYEANVRDRFDGSHPYERLRIIYTREGRFADAIRVCEAYIEFGQDDPKGKAKCRKAIESLRMKAKGEV